MKIANLVHPTEKKPFVAITPDPGDTATALMAAASRVPGTQVIITADFGMGPVLELIEVHPTFTSPAQLRLPGMASNNAA